MASGQMMKASVFVYARDMLLVVDAETTHHLSVQPCELRPAVPLVYLSTTHTQGQNKSKKKTIKGLLVKPHLCVSQSVCSFKCLAIGFTKSCN